MIPLTLDEIARLTHGKIDGGDPDAFATGVAIDSRAVARGSLFVALPGERTDGHRFVRTAAELGAVASLVADDRAPDDAGALIRVDDPLHALGALAQAVRARLHATVVAITGSAGKTSTRALAAEAIASERRTIASIKNYNNEVGVPLTILAADEQTEVLVVEVGARGAGHITALMPMVLPDVSVVTNVGSAHVGMFGSVEGTARAKAELVEALGPEGIAILNADDSAVAAMRAHARGGVLMFGAAPDADVRADGVTFDAQARASFTIISKAERAPVTLCIPGEHMVSNALAAAAAALACGVSLDAAAAALSRCEGVPMRMQVISSGDRVIVNDAYNASPESMVAALKTLVSMARGKPTWAVLGHMAELGDAAVGEHDRIGRSLVRLGVSHVVTIGQDARALHEAARHEGMPPDEAMFVPDIEQALEILRARLEPDAVVLVKGSRAAGLERLIEGLLA